MASDAYISSFDKSGGGTSKTTHISSAGAISAMMEYAVYERKNKLVISVFDTSAGAEAHILTLLRGNNDGRYCVITVPR